MQTEVSKETEKAVPQPSVSASKEAVQPEVSPDVREAGVTVHHEAIDTAQVQEAHPDIKVMGPTVSTEGLGQAQIQTPPTPKDIFPSPFSTGELASGEGAPLNKVEETRKGLLRFVPKFLAGKKPA